MIPSTTNQLLISEDWKKIYQSYRNADFKSYDFETLRRTMITYLRENYPEDFNDYIDSSEYMALVDIIAYLGQNLSFRIDLNARENFLETADRRDSILRLAQLISYNAKRNQAANGFLKIVSVSTNDNVLDANGTSLANQIITWNDPANNNWYQQFISILNSTMSSNFVFGRPYDSAVIDGISTEQYRVNSANNNIPVYGFSANVSGTQMNFEVVSSLFSNKNYVYEEAPKPGTKFSFLYKNDNQGNGSSNTGFFVHFRQGALSLTNFSVDAPVPNQIIGVNVNDINNTDTWLWGIDSSGRYSTEWTKVNDLVGNNIIYNSLNNADRKIYTVTTRDQDQIDINFADGSFGDLPKGNFAFFYRQSNGLNYVIKPQQLSNITLSIPYFNKNGQSSILTVVCSLQSTVANSSAKESNAQIKLKAPQTYYTQNRMITAEDYNIAPLSAGNDILKIKSINRVSSGVSKFFDLVDVSGQYSSTNIFADDGILYKQPVESSFEFNFVNENEVLGAILNQLAPIVASNEMRNFYLDNYPRVQQSTSNFTWIRAIQNTNQTNGYFASTFGPSAVGGFTDNNLKYVTAGALIKFTAPEGYHFLPDNKLTATPSDTTQDYIWVKVVSVVGDGFNSGVGLLDTGVGPITLSGNVPNGVIISQIIPKFANALTSSLQTAIVNTCLSTRNFGLSFDAVTGQWYIITDNNLNLSRAFSLAYQKDAQSINRDASWMVAFEWTGLNYKVYYRTLDYIFESVEQTAFYVDNTIKNYDFVNNTVIKDRVDVLSINDNPVAATTATGNITLTGLVTATYTATVVLTTSTVGTNGLPLPNINVQVPGVSTVVIQPTVTASVTVNVFTASVFTAALSTSTTPRVLYVIDGANCVWQNAVFTVTSLSTVFNTSNSGTYKIVHPALPFGYANVTGTNIVSKIVQIDSTVTTAVASGSTLVFIPSFVTTSTTLVGSTATFSTASNYSYTYNPNKTVTANTKVSITDIPFTASTQTSFSFTQQDVKVNFSLRKDYPWQIDSAIIESDGYINPNKVKISFFDADDNGQIDDPDAFLNIVQPSTTSTQTNYNNKFVFFKLQADGTRYKLTTPIPSYPNHAALETLTSPVDGQMYYFYDPDINVVQRWNAQTVEYVLEPDYFAYYGRSGLKFHYQHNSGQEKRIDPSKTNLIDIYLLTQSYDTEYRNWLATRIGSEPVPPTSNSLEQGFAPALEPIKSVSDELVFQPTRYKVLFGDLADVALQGTFKAVRSTASVTSDNDLKTRILTAIEEFFVVDNWEFGQSFYFSELATYVMNKLTPDITNFIVVPKSVGGFGNLYEVTCQSNEIFINGATVNDITIIDAVTASQLRTNSSVVTSTTGQ
jgi:hypothetical protein